MDEVAVLAAHLRDLKDRTGLSYTALAARLHVSRSTLHRYCLGETVPPDHALVANLARLAGAPREELLELHREWILADTRRDGRPQPPTATTPAPYASARPRTPTPATPNPTPTPATPTPTPTPAPTPHEDTAPPTPPTPPHTPPPSDSGQPPSPAPTHPRRRRTGAAVAAVAALVLGGGAVAAKLAYEPATTPPTTAPAAPATAGTSQTPIAPTAPEARPGAPLTWTADSHVWAHECDHRYLVDRPPHTVPAPPVQQDAQRWARSLGAVHGGTTIVRATLSAARQDATAVVERLTVRVVERRTPPGWPAYAMSSGCGGMLSPAFHAVDLDAPRPLVRPVEGFDGERPLPATQLPYRVRAGDPLVVRVEATAVRCDCAWVLEAEWSSGERRGTVRIDDGGRPFRTSGVAAGREYAYDDGAKAWRG
ncbi:helix-turn-helix domain-containing protein [Streptomyces rubrolavendulae]|uniref:helix-turn-helix domain-containing protein n=1 Tax=Streptomyces rubrolavendulae TaxID=285473 RepID=UPI0021BC126C|nr:helix-turn-helix transcriptional regulator [Streptomyces rubrolavendulae]